MLKNRKDHHVPDFEAHKTHQIKSHGGYAAYDPLHDLEPAELATEKMKLVKSWIQKETDIELALLIGSYARGDQREDSDIDYILMTESMKDYIEETHWAKKFGQVVSITSEIFEEVTALRIYYQDEIELEFGFVTKEWLEMPLKDATQEAISNGCKVLKDVNKIMDKIK